MKCGTRPRRDEVQTLIARVERLERLATATLLTLNDLSHYPELIKRWPVNAKVRFVAATLILSEATEEQLRVQYGSNDGSNDTVTLANVLLALKWAKESFPTLYSEVIYAH